MKVGNIYFVILHWYQINLGIDHAVRTVHKGIRNTSVDFLRTYNKTNLTIRTGTFVGRIILEKNNSFNREGHEYKAIGVEAHDEA
jgi:hypothetical protein